jgi:hypothetical protein
MVRAQNGSKSPARPSPRQPPASSGPPTESISSQRVARGVAALRQLDADRQVARESVSLVRIDDSDDEVDSPSPVYYSFLNEDDENIVALTNFAPVEFERLWGSVRGYIIENWNVGRGRKCTQRPKDMLFMLLTCLKHCGKWDVVSSVFGIKAGTFQKAVTGFAEVLAPFLYNKFVAAVSTKFSMRALVLSGNTFKYHQFARYTTDVTFQHANMPSGNMKERSGYYSAKHHLHGYKVEVSVLPNGLAVNCTAHYPGNKADIEIFRDNHEFHLQELRKADDERDLTDDGPMADEYPDSWCVLADKGYQGLASDFRAITPHKKRPLHPLSLVESETNDRIAHDRVIVENFFGRMCTLWSICSDKYRWDERKYDTFFRLCVAMTNYHIRIMPLRQGDGVNHGNYTKRLRVIGDSRQAKRARTQKKYRAKRRARLRSLLAVHAERPNSDSPLGAMATADSISSAGDSDADWQASVDFME